TIASIWEALFPRRFTGGGIGHRVVMVWVVGPFAARLNCPLRRVSRNQAVAAISDEVLVPGFQQSFPHSEPVFGLEELHQSPLHFPIPHAPGNVDGLLREGIDARVVKCCCNVEWGRDEVLYLIGAIAIALQIYGEVDHRIEIRTWVAGDEVRDQKL